MNREIDEDLMPVFGLINKLQEVVDILIQHSENYYVMCEMLCSNRELAASRIYRLTRNAVGFEIVNRIPDYSLFSSKIVLGFTWKSDQRKHFNGVEIGIRSEGP